MARVSKERFSLEASSDLAGGIRESLMRAYSNDGLLPEMVENFPVLVNQAFLQWAALPGYTIRHG